MKRPAKLTALAVIALTGALTAEAQTCPPGWWPVPPTPYTRGYQCYRGYGPANIYWQQGSFDQRGGFVAQRGEFNPLPYTPQGPNPFWPATAAVHWSPRVGGPFIAPHVPPPPTPIYYRPRR